MPQNATENITPEYNTITSAAKAAGVARETVHRWMKEDWNFQSELNKRMKEIQEATTARLLSLSLSASVVVEKAIKKGDVKASIAILTGVGVLTGELPHIGISDPDALREDAGRWHFAQIMRCLTCTSSGYLTPEYCQLVSPTATVDFNFAVL
jgi:hypothetical protein